MDNFPSWFETLQKSHLIAPLSTFRICRTSSSKWIYFCWTANCPSNSVPWIQMLPMSTTKTFTILNNVCRCLALHLLKSGLTSFVIDHSSCSRMIVILEKSSILWRCQNPYHHRWQTCHLRNSPYLFPTFLQISTLEKITCRQCSILSSLMSWRPIRVSPYLFAAHWTNSEVRSDFHIWFFTRTFRCSRDKHVRIPHAVFRYQVHHRLWFCCDSFFICIFWCSFRHCFKIFDGTEIADAEQTQKMIPFITCEISLSICLRLDSWCQCTWFGSWGPNWFYSNNQSRATLWVLEPCLIVGLLLYDPLDHCFVITHTTKLPYKKHQRLKKENQHCLDHQSFHETSFAFEVCEGLRESHVDSCTGLPVLDYSDTCFREELRRSDPINQVRESRPISIPRPRTWFLILLNCAKIEVCFLHIQLIGTNVWRPKMHNVPPEVDFESSRSPTKSESWNSPSLQCSAVFPTWQYDL